MPFRKLQTLSRIIQTSHQGNSRGIITTINELQRRGEGEWLATAWDAQGKGPGSASPDLDPHLLRIPRGRVLTSISDTAVWTSSQRMVGMGASSYPADHDDRHGQLEHHPHYRHSIWHRPYQWPPSLMQIDTPVFVLHSPWSHNNYFHFMMDLLPRLGIFLLWQQASSTSIPIITTLKLSGYRAEVLARTGATSLKAAGIEPTGTLHLQASQLHVTTLARNSRALSPLPLHYLRSLFRNECTSTRPDRLRLLIQRDPASSRPMRNQQDLVEALLPLGFLPIQPEKLTVSEQARMFGRAEAVVGQHGAGMTNLAFCPPACKVIELFDHGWHAPYFQQISHHASLQHHGFECQSFPDRSLEVDIPALITHLKALQLT